MNFRKLLKRLGPGFVTGTSDNDPAGVGTYVQTGAKFGYQQLWIPLFLLPSMIAIQEMCGRIGTVTGQGLSTVIRNNYSRPVLMIIIIIQVITNAVNIGADLSAMAESAQLLWHIPYYLLLAMITFITAALIVFIPYKNYAIYLKLLGLTLLTYIITAFTVHVDWQNVFTAMFVPHFKWNKEFILMLIAVFGVTISPYEFFWQSDEEVEELVQSHKIVAEESSRPNTTSADIKFLRNDTIFGMFFSNLINFIIIVMAAATLNAHGYINVQNAAQAAEVLRPLAGSFTFFLFAIGILSAGLLSIPVMAASSAYAIGGAFGWPRSLGSPFWQEWRFYGIIVGSCLVGLLVNALHVPPFKLLYYSAILNGLISPPLLFIVTQISNNRKIMGEFVNSTTSNIAGGALCIFMTLALIGFLVLSSY